MSLIIWGKNGNFFQKRTEKSLTAWIIVGYGYFVSILVVFDTICDGVMMCRSTPDTHEHIILH